MASNGGGIAHAIKKTAGLGESFVGIDVGTSSIKIVQLRLVDDIVTLETYGEIETARYADSSYGHTRANESQQGSALQDLLHEVDARSRVCGMAVPLSDTLLNLVDLPKRDPEQMRVIVPAEAKQYIPVPMESVMIDWYALPDPNEDEDVFDTLKPKQKVEAKFQKVMIVAIKKEVAVKLSEVVRESALSPAFYEIEMFSVARSCGHDIDVPTLILDLGASTTKAYIMDEHRLMLGARFIPIGGHAITDAVAKALACDAAAAERAKCESGLSEGSDAADAIKDTLAPLWTYVRQMEDEYGKDGSKKIQNVLLAGGGADMPGLSEFLATKYPGSVSKAEGFRRTKGPMILENTLKEDGPRYTVAAGLALRGIGA